SSAYLDLSMPCAVLCNLAGSKVGNLLFVTVLSFPRPSVGYAPVITRRLGVHAEVCHGPCPVNLWPNTRGTHALVHGRESVHCHCSQSVERLSTAHWVGSSSRIGRNEYGHIVVALIALLH